MLTLITIFLPTREIMDYRMEQVLLLHLQNLGLECRRLNLVSNIRVKRSCTLVILRISDSEHTILVLVIMPKFKNNVNKHGLILKLDIQIYVNLM